MKITLASTSTGSTITGSNLHSTWNLHLPLMAGDVSALLARLLQDPDRAEVEQDGLQIVRAKEGVSLRTSAGTVEIPWPMLFAIEGAVSHA